MYGLSAFSEFWWNVNGHVLFLYRLWYLLGAILVPAYLGQGTLYLLMKRRNADIIMAALGLATLYAVVRVFTVNIDISGLTTLTGIGVMPADIRFFIVPIFNAFGTFALIGGALYSAFIFWRKRIMPYRVLSNILIAGGALLPAAGGVSISMAGNINAFFILELLGAIVMFIGFLRSEAVFGLSRFPLIHGFKRVGEA